MAYAALDSLAKYLDSILDKRFQTSGFQYHVFQEKLNIERLYGNTVFLLNFLIDFAREADKLEERVTNAAIQANTFLLEFAREEEAIQTKNINLGSMPKRTLNALLKAKGLLFDEVVYNQTTVQRHQKFCQGLEKSIGEIDFIREEAMQIKGSKKINAMPSRGGGAVVGIEEDLLEMKNRLCGGASDLRIIPIVGMGGIGKTTLARYTYDDPLTAYHFDVRVWVKISQNYDLRAILYGILRSVKNEDKHWYFDDEKLKERVYKCLKGMRYLIVMDDVWDTNLWDDVRNVFPDDHNGSRIVITTRDLNTASYIDSLNHPHQMRLMGVEQSWRLLKERVFEQEDCLPELEKIGQLIAENCRGLPLAVVVIAGVLSGKVNRKKEHWEMIARNVSKVVSTDSEQFTKILSLSYKYLPGCLRPCFLYMGCFPQDHEIHVSKLVRLWAAEGFLTSDELGYEYVEDLAKRSLVLINKKRYDGKIRTVKIHDLLRDLCLRKCRDENFLCTIDEFSGTFPPGIENANRLGVFCYVSNSIPNTENSPTHTVLLFNHWAVDSWKGFRLLKVFDGLTVALRSSTSVICIRQLIHLRYLALTCESTSKTLQLLSESFYHLQNLQTLIFRITSPEGGLESVDEFRNQWYMELEIWRIPHLRHLIMLDGFLPDPCAGSFSSMENLLTLSRMKDFKCSERFLEMAPNLQKLGVIYSYEATYEGGWSQYGLRNLVHLHKLEKLSLFAEPYPNLKDDLSQSIVFPLTLKKLNLSGCRLMWEDMRMIGALPNLEVLKLKRRACCGTEWETSEGEFCQLRVLLIDSTDLLQWITESSHFPKLERLTIYECDNLKEIPYSIGEIPTLELLEVDVRNWAMVESAKCIEEEQQSFGNDLLKLRFLKSRSWDNSTL